MSIAAAVGGALFQGARPAGAVPLPNPETAGNRGVRFSGGAKAAAGANARRQEALKKRVALLKAQGAAAPASKAE